MRISPIPALLLASLVSISVLADDQQARPNFEESWEVDPAAALKQQTEAARQEMAANFETDAVGEDEVAMRDALNHDNENLDAGVKTINKMEMKIEVLPLALPPRHGN